MGETQEKKKGLTVAEIRAVEDRKLEMVDIPEWGGAVYLRPMSGVERDEMEGLAIRIDDATERGQAIKKFFVLELVVNEDGEKLFKEEDWVWLMKKSSSAILKIVRHVREDNGLGPQAAEETAKN